MRWVVGAVIVIAAGALGWPEGPRSACAACRHKCDAGETRDAHGCCHKKTAQVAHKGTKKKKTKKRPHVVTSTGPDLNGGAATVVTTGDVKLHHKKSVDELVSGCQGGDSRDCGDFAVMYDGTTPALDDSTLASMYGTGCDGGEMRACLRLGEQYENGNGVTQDFDKASALYQKACDKGDPVGCHALGRIYYLALGVVKDVDRALKLFQRACDGGVAASCSDLGYVYENAIGDYVTAAQWYVTACDQGDATGCHNAASLYRQAGDDTTAQTLQQKACALGDASSC